MKFLLLHKIVQSFFRMRIKFNFPFFERAECGVTMKKLNSCGTLVKENFCLIFEKRKYLKECSIEEVYWGNLILVYFF